MKPTAASLPRLWREAASLVAWWAMITLTLWVLGRMLGVPTALGPCAASAALMVVIGEAGDWTRRHWKSRRRGA
ncbi:hypothetical protein [Streptomyces sp. NPDC090021]|uniref:hypothetical protein n=1 Tax=Streptomyces sp. NPDC090021 TaxID=3365919 RepID=UPI00380E077E